MADGSSTAPPRRSAPGDMTSQHDLRGVLAIRPFRLLWMALATSSMGTWLGLLAITALAAQLAQSEGGDFRAANYAIGGVLLLKLLPALLLGPFAGVVADRFNRRWTMVGGDVVRAGLTLSIPLVGKLWWVLVATVLIECASLFWIPAKEAMIPNLVPRERLESANQLNLLGTYGTAPVAAAVFAGLSLLPGIVPNMPTDSLSLALGFNAMTFLVSGLAIARISGLPERAQRADGQASGVWSTLVEGWKYVGTNRTIRGLVGGIIGAFAAGGVVIGLARPYVADLGAGNPGYGLLVGTVFTGLALGMLVAPRLLVGLSRRRRFTLSIIGVGCTLVLIAVLQNIVLVSLLALVVGAFAGIAWVTGYTLLGLEVADEVRGRTFAFIQNAIQLTLIGVLAAAPFVAGTIGSHALQIGDEVRVTYSGASIAMLFGGVLAVVVGLASYRNMDDRHGVPLLADVIAAVRGESSPDASGYPGMFVVFEGGEGVGKSTQARLLAEWLHGRGHEVVLTHEPGATPIGRQLRQIVLDVDTVGLGARAEALLYAADRAQHVEAVVRPALERGAVVVSDRFSDSSVAYQAAGRRLAPEEIARISTWATGGLRPDLVVLLDLQPEVGRSRFEAPADRVESEPLDFHERVRHGFREQARRTPARYLVLDASEPVNTLRERIRRRLLALLPAEAADAPKDAEVSRANGHAGEQPEAARLDAERADADREDADRVDALRMLAPGSVTGTADVPQDPDRSA